MTLVSHVVTEVQQPHLEALRIDLQIAFKECGPRFLTRHPTYGERFFVVAAEDTILDKEMCSKHSETHRSALKETLNEDELDRLIVELRREGYEIKKCEKGGDDIVGRWIQYKAIYYPDHDK